VKRFAVVGCRDCHHHWIAEDLRDQDTVQCPRCGLTRESRLVRPQADADNWYVACELRARLLAQRAGELETFTEEWDDFGVLDDQINFSVATTSPEALDEKPLHSDVFAEEVDQRLEHWSEQRRDVLQEEAETYLDRRFATITPEADPDDRPDRSLDVFENADGTISVPQQTDVTAPVRVQADCSPADLWQRLATTDAFQEVLVEAVRDVLAGVPSHERVRTLLDVGVIGADGGLARALAGLDRAPETDAHQRTLNLVAGIGQDGMTDLGHLPIEEVVRGPLAVLDAAETVPTVAVHLGQAFRERRREQREDILWMLAALGRVVDLRVAATGLTVRWLLSEHRSDLPTAFRESLNAHSRDHTDVDERVRAAHEELDREGRSVHILRDLAAEPGETLLYSELTSLHQVSRSRISQLLTQLEDLGLVERFGPRDQTQVELLPAGSAYLDVLDEESERQDELDAAFSDPFQDSNDSRVTTRTGDPPAPPGGSPDRERCPYHHSLSWLDRPEHTAVASAASDGGLGLVNHTVEPLDDRAAPLASYSDDREELLVGAEYDNPMAWMTSTALALVNRRVFGRVELEDRLADQAHTFQELIDGGREILRDSRCIGWLSDDIEDVGEFVDALLEGREQLTELTKRWRHGEFEDASQFRGEILRLAHGLAGTAVHLYDLVDIDVVRFLRIPRFKQFDEDDREDLAEVLATHVAITSRYGQFSAYRALFENREQKRRTAMTPTVDASDPLGRLIGGITLIGPDVDDVEDELTKHLSEPRDLAEDVPEFAVRAPVKTPDRTVYAETVQRMCAEKNLAPQREAVTILRALTGSPLDVADALNWLSREEDRRDLRLDEVRIALGKLDAERLLPETKPSVSKMLNALLRSEQPLSVQALADAADVSRSSVWRHLPTLEDLALVEDGGDGEYRLTLPFATSEERGRDIVPDPLDDCHSVANDLLLDVVLDAVGVEEAGRIGNSDDPLGRAFYAPYDYTGLREELPWINPWIRVAQALCDDPDPGPVKVQFGAPIEQTALPDGDFPVEKAPAD